jgi:hypothetical protein
VKPLREEERTEAGRGTAKATVALLGREGAYELYLGGAGCVEIKLVELDWERGRHRSHERALEVISART